MVREIARDLEAGTRPSTGQRVATSQPSDEGVASLAPLRIGSPRLHEWLVDSDNEGEAPSPESEESEEGLGEGPEGEPRLAFESNAMLELLLGGEDGAAPPRTARVRTERLPDQVPDSKPAVEGESGVAGAAGGVVVEGEDAVAVDEGVDEGVLEGVEAVASVERMEATMQRLQELVQASDTTVTKVWSNYSTYVHIW